MNLTRRTSLTPARCDSWTCSALAEWVDEGGSRYCANCAAQARSKARQAARTEVARRALAAQTVAELRDLALDAELRGFSRLRKAELVELLIPTQLADMDLAEANHADVVSRETPAPHPTVLDGSLVSAAIRAKETYLEVVGRLGAENGGPEVSAAWEDYLDACHAAETCARTDCWNRATDDGRCGRHSWGPALGDDVVRTEADQAMAEELQASPVATWAEEEWAAEVLAPAERCSEPNCEAEACRDDSRCLPHAQSAGDACFAAPAEVRTPADVWARVQAAKEAAMAELKAALPQSGYTDCACRDCFDAAISSDVTRPEPCLGCVEEGCELGDSECNQPDAYGE